MRSLVLSSIILAGFAGAAQADVMAGGALFGSPSQTVAVCYLYNAGNASVTVSNFRITTQGGFAPALTTNECGSFPATIAPGRSCGIAVAANNQAFNCRAVVSAKGAMRGVFEVRGSTGQSLANTDLR